MSRTPFQIALDLIVKIDIRTEITDEFNRENKFITLAKKRRPHHVQFNKEFAHIRLDVVLERKDGNTYAMGEATSCKSVISILETEPIILSKEKAEDKVAQLLEDGYEIIMNPCMEKHDALSFINEGALILFK